MPPRLRRAPPPPRRPPPFLVAVLLLLSVMLRDVAVEAFLQPGWGSRRGSLQHHERRPHGRHSPFAHDENQQQHPQYHLHDKATVSSLPPGAVVPEHLAFVLDGNGRWAQQRGLPRGAGHMEGTKRAFEVLKACQALGVRIVTLYCLSTENWRRPAAELAIILACVESSLRANLDYAHKNRIRLVVIGQMHRLPSSLQVLVTRAEAETAGYTDEDGMTVCLALSYGGRDDIVQACRALANQAATGEIQPQEIDEALFESRLSTHRKGVSRPPDLVVRTSGEQRWSNFMLFECAYSEFYVSEALWPAFKEGNLVAALESYGRRRRRFGGVAESKLAAETATEREGGKVEASNNVM